MSRRHARCPYFWPLKRFSRFYLAHRLPSLPRTQPFPLRPRRKDWEPVHLPGLQAAEQDRGLRFLPSMHV